MGTLMKSNEYVVGLVGRAGLGKNTVAEQLILASGLEGRVISFAGSLKRFAWALGWNGKKDEKGRRLLQLLGTELGRECIDEDIWVDKWEVERNQMKRGGVVLFVSADVRFQNEVDHIRGLGGCIVRITGRETSLNENLASHPSENVEELPCDMEFDNSGSLEELPERVEELWDQIRAFIEEKKYGPVTRKASEESSCV